MPNEFFQPWFVQLISVLSDLFVGLSAVGVAILACWGLKQWRVELEGKVRFEIARRMVSLAFQFRDEFKRARSGEKFFGKSSERQKGDDETPEKARLLNKHFRRRKGLEPLQETLRKLYESAWETEAITDENVSKFIEPLENTYKRLDRAVTIYFSTKLKLQSERQENQVEYTFRDFIIESDELESYRSIIYSSDDDEMSQSVDAAVNTLAEELKKLIG